ncbi:hypothetical protein L218DRAFT_956072 [Marasmius fiardii PR-910]|nr:hypothetical protein L218DRAFT_956072 [Marasmius fiardii PR-910]
MNFAPRLFVSALALFAFFSSLVAGAVEIRYIDDETGDPLTGLKPNYTPSNQWSLGSVCTGCNIHPNVSLAYNGTWHDTTHFARDSVGRSVQLTFTGIGLSVFCIIPSSSAQAIINYDLKFTLDGSPVGNDFSLQPNSTDYQYNVPVITLEDLPNKEHEFTMEASSTTTDSVVLFDYATYLFDGTLPIINDNSSVSGSSKNNIGAIVGGVIAGIVFLLGMAAAVFLRRRRRKMQQEKFFVTPEPFVQSPHTYAKWVGQEPGPQSQDQTYLPTVGSSFIIRPPTTLTSQASTHTGSPASPLARRYLEEKSEPAGLPPGPPPAYEE